MPLPGRDAAQLILKDTLLSLAESFPGLRELALSPGLATVAARAAGLDGRRVRKLVFEALSLRRETVLDPTELTMHDLAAAADAAVEQDLAAQKENARAAV